MLNGNLRLYLIAICKWLQGFRDSVVVVCCGLQQARACRHGLSSLHRLLLDPPPPPSLPRPSFLPVSEFQLCYDFHSLLLSGRALGKIPAYWVAGLLSWHHLMMFICRGGVTISDIKQAPPPHPTPTLQKNTVVQFSYCYFANLYSGFRHWD